MGWHDVVQHGVQNLGILVFNEMAWHGLATANTVAGLTVVRFFFFKPFDVCMFVLPSSVGVLDARCGV